jgi:hypothetical protein
MQMLESIATQSVRFAVASTPRELKSCLASLPYGVQYGMARDLEETGKAHRYDCSCKRTYFLRQDDRGILVWIWSPIRS